MKKYFALLIAALLIVGTAAYAPASSDSSKNEASKAESSAAAESSAEAEASTAESSADAAFTTVEEGVLIMATNAEFPPYEYHEGDQVVGIDAEIAQAIAEKLGLTLRIEDMEFDSIISSFKGGKADVGLAGMTVTEERQEEVNFSTSFWGR